MPSSGPSRTPRRKLVKKFNYNETVQLNNATTTYAYYTSYVKPDVTKAQGSAAQFAAFELWRIKKLRVSIQMANTPGASGASALNNVPTTTVWTAADLGSNESISGETIMQYQNVKRNTPSLNKWTCVVDTSCNVNASLDTSTNSSYILPASTWLNTSLYNSSSYSGYQIFIQNFGIQNNTVDFQTSYTIQTELEIEFMQPAFQNNASNFTVEAFGMKMVTQPDANNPTDLRTYVFEKYNVFTHQSGASAGQREFSIRLTRQDGLPGSLTFTGEELRNAIITGTSTPYFSGRPILYDGPMPPKEIPAITYEVVNFPLTQ
eukprot:292162_1